MIHARATLSPIRTLLHGDVTLPARGTYAVTLTIGERLRQLRVGWATADLTRDGDTWRGQIIVDGYRWDVTAYPGTPAWEVEFHG
jgi:hypothetical protein